MELTNYTSAELYTYSVHQLRRVARTNGHSGVWVLNLKKDKLVELIVKGSLPDMVLEEANQAKRKFNGEDFEAAIVKTVDNYLAKNNGSGMNEYQIEKLIEKRISETTIKEIVIKKQDGTKINVGKQHLKFQEVLEDMQVGLNLWLYGEAGSGKTTLAKNAAKALGLKFYSQSVTQQTTKADLLGFIDAGGNYIESLFFKAYRDGGVFLLDEADNGSPNVLNVLNAATANDICAFPCGMIGRHEDFRMIAAANTIGDGATRQFVGRLALDFATKTRYVYVQIDTDWNLVQDIVNNKYGVQGERFFKTCMNLRNKINYHTLTNIAVTSRTVFDGCKMVITLGRNLNDVLHGVLFKGCDQTTINKVLA